MSIKIGGGSGQMTPCNGSENSTTWCCESHITSCWGTDSEVTLLPISYSTTPSSVPLVASSTTISSSTSSSTPNPVFSTGATAAIVVCATIAGLALIALAILLWRWKQRKAALEGAYLGTPQGPTELVSPSSRHNSEDPSSQAIQRIQLEGPEKPLEKDGPDSEAHELV